ncbi:urease accessory protein UreD [Pontibacter qinzhouensis]|uniref:Urease accessory protein UreD n=1 Tax=Pontibacter qinzhouensis TaxID=2603253 RepID=A0A5C8K4M3_9BACT|nr:urease accessory protein UreD [Pontibacter qinzhouensis]TXK44147.1 urease accessory protein UreD [Pontibacter qinzhouensis]
MNQPTTWSEIEVAEVRQKSKLVSSRSIQPLKILNPGSHYSSCHVVLSSYGGGMVAGDKIWLKVRCGANARLFLNTQANTKIFKSLAGETTEQLLQGDLAENALAVVFPDPVVLQEASRYRQVQHWHLQPGALLFLVDWFHSGRMDLGEQFAFTALASELKVWLNRKLLILDRFSFRPEEHIATSPANFNHYHTIFSAYLIGTPANSRFEQLANQLLQLKMQEATGLHFNIPANDFVVTVTRVKEEVVLLRAIAKTRIDLLPLCDKLMQELASADYLGYNPVRRKF